MSQTPVTAAQLVRLRAIYFRHATEKLKSAGAHARRCVMRMLLAVERNGSTGIPLAEDSIRSIFFASITPGFIHRDDETYHACRLMMLDVENLNQAQ